jgi:predicted phosphodiesterase
MRCFAISDLHTDFAENLRAVRNLSPDAYGRDALLVAGDIADRFEVIEETLFLLSSKFGKVFYVPGNHELWVRFDGCDSLEKLRRVRALCRRLGVHVEPARAGDVWVVPLLSWYETRAELLTADAAAELEGWADFYFCAWPESPEPVADRFLRMNEPSLRRAYDGEVITLSHFLPRRDLLPDTSELTFKALPQVAVCRRLDEQLRGVGSRVHVFGHSHIPCDRVVDGVRYVQNAFGYPREGASTFKVMQVWPPPRAAERAAAEAAARV